MWSLLTILLSATAVQGISLFDALKQAGAGDFANIIASNPNLTALYNSNKVRTVFAPIDGSSLSRKLKRQLAGIGDDQLQASDDILDIEAANQRMRRTVSVGIGQIISTFANANLGNGTTQNVITDPSNSTQANIAKRNYNHTSTIIWSAPPTKSIKHSTTDCTTPVALPPPTTVTIYSQLSPTTDTVYAIDTVYLQPSPTTVTVHHHPSTGTNTIYLQPSPTTVTIYPQPSIETDTVYLQPSPTIVTVLSPPSPTTVTILLPPSPITVTLSPAPSPTTVTLSSQPSPSPSPLLKIYAGLGKAANVIEANIPYDGGLIQLMDAYFTPPELITDTAIAEGHTTFAQLSASANLSSTINYTPRITCFIPTNAAFAMPNSTSSYASTASLLSSHIVPNFLGYRPSLTNGSTLTTQGGTQLTVTTTGNDIFINNAKIIDSNLITINGVCHVVDSVIVSGTLLPAPFTGDALPSVKRNSATALWGFAISLGATLLI